MSLLILSDESSGTDRGLEVSYVDLTVPSVNDNRVELSWTELELAYSAADSISVVVGGD